MDKIKICNKALSLLGDKKFITNIDNPETAEEKECFLWFEETKKQALIEATPNFAIERKVIALSTKQLAFGDYFCYQKPNDCLKVLSVGEAENIQVDFKVEGNYIITEENYNNSLPIRYIKNIENYNMFSPFFINYLSFCLASNLCTSLTKDQQLKQIIEQLKLNALNQSRTNDNQESKIKIISRKGKYKTSRY